jgi:hypothetical protein
MKTAKQKSWPYCGDRVKKWKQKNGVGVFTLIPASTAEAIKREAQKASSEITQVVYRVWLSRGHEKRFLDPFTETCRNR